MNEKETEDLEEEMNIDDSQCVRCGRERLPDSAFCAPCDCFVSEFGDIV
jgi:uncharacterized OB-fold protein